MSGAETAWSEAGGHRVEAKSTVIELCTHSPEETLELGRWLARHLPHGCLVILDGELGSGKTTLTKGIVSGLGAGREEEVTSPSFTLVHEYGDAPKVYHADLYRIETAQEIATLGLDEALDQNAVLIVEWGRKLDVAPTTVRLDIKIELVNDSTRRLKLEAFNWKLDERWPGSVASDTKVR